MQLRNSEYAINLSWIILSNNIMNVMFTKYDKKWKWETLVKIKCTLI